MKYFLKLTLLLTFFLVNNLNSRELHVSCSINGNDLNIGSLLYPFKSLNYAFSKLNENDTLTIHEGEYYVSKTINLKNNITIKAYNKDKVIIKNLVPKLKWINEKDNIWKSKVDDTVLQVFVNERPFFQASFPSIEENIYALKNGGFAIALPSKEIIVPGINKFNDISGAGFLSIHGINIIAINGTVLSQNNDKLKVKSDAFCWKEEFKKEYLDTGKIVLYGKKEFLNDEYEWYLKNKELYLISSENPNDKKIEIRESLYVFSLENLKNVTISNISFFGGNINLSESENCKIKNCVFLYPTPFFSFFEGFEKFNTHFDENNTPYVIEPSNWSGKGITISGKKNTIENCYIAHSWGDGITIWGENQLIKNNIIEDCDWISNDCANVTITGKNHTFINNSLSKSSRSLLIHRDIENSIINYNEFSKNGFNCEDLGMTASYISDGKNTEIAYNYLHDSKAQIRSHGIYLDNGNSNYKVHHNIISNILNAIQLNIPAKNILVYNNSIYKCKNSMGSWGALTAEFSNIKTFNNITNSPTKSKFVLPFIGTQQDSNHIYFDNNIFVDPANHNFQLRKNSYPIDRGIKNEYTTDYKGSAPDMGALESGIPPWKYGSSLIIPNEKYYPPKAPLQLELVANTFDTTLLRWNYPFQLIDSFYVERKSATESIYTIIARLAATDTLYNDANQPPGEYRYQVRAKNSYGISEPSNSIQIFNPITNNSLYFDAEESDLQEGTNAMGDLLINTDNKDWICFKGIELANSTYDACMVNMAVPCENAWQEIQVRLDHPMGRMIGKFRTPSTGGWDKFKMYSFPIEQIKGTHDVYFRFKGNYGVGTMDWFTLYDSNGEVKENIPYDSLCPFPSLKNREAKMRVFPNPVYREINLTLDCQEKSTLEVEVFDTKGVVYYTNTFENLLPGTVEIHLHDDPKVNALLPGVYMVKAHITSKKVDSFSMMKFIKTNE